MKIDGSMPKNITKYPSIDNHPAISPDGEKIAFVSSRNFDNEIYVVNKDGSNLSRISNHPGMDTYPDWSPDGKQIVFVSDRDNFNDNLYIQDLEAPEKPVIQLTKNEGFDTHPKWSPDGSKIAFVSDRDGTDQIYMMNTTGENIRKLTKGSAPKSHPGWSPDGSKIAFVQSNDTYKNNDIYILDLKQNNQTTQLTKNIHWDSQPDWKDSNHILFVSNRTGTFELYQINTSNNKIDQLTNNQFYDSEPRWN